MTTFSHTFIGNVLYTYQKHSFIFAMMRWAEHLINKTKKTLYQPEEIRWCCALAFATNNCTLFFLTLGVKIKLWKNKNFNYNFAAKNRNTSLTSFAVFRTFPFLEEKVFVVFYFQVDHLELFSVTHKCRVSSFSEIHLYKTHQVTFFFFAKSFVSLKSSPLSSETRFVFLTWTARGNESSSSSSSSSLWSKLDSSETDLNSSFPLFM